MDPCESVVGSIRLEMNHIYTEKPFRTPDGCDFGWFCREHALQLGALLTCLGYQATICTGDVFVRVPGEIVISSVGSGADHAWCASAQVTPIDASLTLKHFQVSCPDVDLVCNGCGQYLAGFCVRYFRGISDAAFTSAADTREKVIAYNERGRIAASISVVVQDPFQFLHRPPPGARSLLDLYGPDVLFAITAHLLKLARGEVKPLFTYQSPSDAIRTMVRRNPGARALVLEAVANAAT